MKGKEISFYVP